MKVSVVIPVFQTERYVEDCLRSVLKQTLQDFEIICILDGGNDGSKEVVKRLMQEDSRISLHVNKQNLGPGASRNRGLALAKGEYIYFLDSDDMILTETLQELYEISRSNRLDTCIFSADFVYENEMLEEKFCRDPSRFKGSYPEVMTGKELFKAWMKVWDWMPSPPRYFCRRNFLVEKSIRFREGMLHEDEIFAFDILMSAHRVKVVDKPYFIRRFRADSIMSSPPAMKNVEGCIEILTKMHEYRDLRNLKEEDGDLDAGILFYESKVTETAVKKYKMLIAGSRSEELPEKITSDPLRKGIFEKIKRLSHGETPDCKKQSPPKVSVLIPAYNVEDYVAECMESVLCQTLQDFEIICVDDCSTDRTPEILKDYSERDDRIRVYHHDRNLGQAAGRNLALSHASGEYVYMLDADDKILPEALGECYAVCAGSSLDLLAFETQNFTDDSRFRKNAALRTVQYSDTAVLNGREALIYCMDTESLSTSTPTYMMRRDYLTANRIRFTEGILHEDIGFLLEMITKAERVRFWHRVFFLRRIRANSTMTKGFTARNIEGYLKSFYKSFELEKELKAALDSDVLFEKAFRKWQRDMFGRINQLYENSAGTIGLENGGTVDEEIRRAFAMIKLAHWRMDSLNITECYLCGTGQYTRRAIEAVGAQDAVIRGIIVLEKDRNSFCGFPLIAAEEANPEIPVVLSVSRYTKDEYREALENGIFRRILESEF